MMRMNVLMAAVLVALLGMLWSGCGRETTGTEVGQSPTYEEQLAQDRTEVPTGVEQPVREAALTEELRNDHEMVMNLLNTMIDQPDPAQWQGRLRQLEAALVPHMTGEEQVIYPVLQQMQGQDRMLGLMAEEEHMAARRAVQELRRGTYDQRAVAKLALIRDDLRTHVEREEQQIFPVLQANYDEATMTRMHDQFRAAKQQAMAELGTGTTPTQEPASTSPNTTY